MSQIHSPETAMSEYELQTLIVTKLSELAVGQAEIATDMSAVKTHLEKLNSKVAAHEKELNERRNVCPLVDRVEARVRTLEDANTTRSATEPLVDEMESRVRSLEDSNTARLATDKSNSHWLTRLWPLIWAALGIFGLIVLQHAHLLLKQAPTP
jgi:hypothetical protein